MVDTQIACLAEDVLPALKKQGINLVDYAELHLHERDQVIQNHTVYLVIIRYLSEFCMGFLTVSFPTQKRIYLFPGNLRSGENCVTAAQTLLQVVIGAHFNAIGSGPRAPISLYRQPDV
jgi:hypothetical protein